MLAAITAETAAGCTVYFVREKSQSCTQIEIIIRTKNKQIGATHLLMQSKESDMSITAVYNAV